MSRVSEGMGHRHLRDARLFEWLGINIRPKRTVRRPTEDVALRRILRDEKRAARAARQQAWAKGQRGEHSREEEG